MVTVKIIVESITDNNKKRAPVEFFAALYKFTTTTNNTSNNVTRVILFSKFIVQKPAAVYSR